MSLLILILLSILFVFITYKLYQKPRFKLPPGPHPWPIVGNNFNIKPPTFRCFSEWSRAYGPIISVWLGSSLNIIVSTSELAEEVLKENDHQLANRHRNIIATKFTNGGKDLTWADYGPHYVKVRRVCALELFSPRSLEALRSIREDEVTAMVESIFRDCINPKKNNNGKVLTMRNYFREATINIITRMVLGKRFASSEPSEFRAIMDNEARIGAPLGLVEHIPWLNNWIFWFKKKEFDKIKAQSDRLTRGIIEERAVAGRNGGGAKQHFVDALLIFQEKYELSDDTVSGLLWDMINAGTDTSAIAVEWAMAKLIKNPNLQHNAQQELDRVIGSDRDMTELDLANLPYLQCIAKEALRLHPPTPLMLPHKASADVKIGGYDIPKGSNLHVNVWAIGRDPVLWHNPLEFRPERFIEEDVDMKGHDFRLLRCLATFYTNSTRTCPKG